MASARAGTSIDALPRTIAAGHGAPGEIQTGNDVDVEAKRRRLEELPGERTSRGERSQSGGFGGNAAIEEGLANMEDDANAAEIERRSVRMGLVREFGMRESLTSYAEEFGVRTRGGPSASLSGARTARRGTANEDESRPEFVVGMPAGPERQGDEEKIGIRARCAMRLYTEEAEKARGACCPACRCIPRHGQGQRLRES